MSLEWLDTYQIDEGLVRSTGAPQYPVAAWNHEFGGFVAEVDKIDGFDCVLPWPVETVKFGRGAKATRKECYATRRADVAILATRTRWFDRATDERLPDYREGAYSRLQLLVLVKDADGGPFLLSFKGVAAGEMAKALTAVRRGPIAAGRRATGKNLAEAAFWLTIYAGEAVTVGAQQATEITPPRVEMPGKGEDAVQWLGARYIGAALLIGVNELADEVNSWANSDAGGANGHESHEGGAHTPSATARPAWLAPEEPEDAFPPDDDFDGLPSASQEPAQRAALAGAGKDRYWDLARAKGLYGNTQAEIMARAAEVSGDWTGAIAWLQGLA
jgi:hypothetical protein